LSKNKRQNLSPSSNETLNTKSESVSNEYVEDTFDDAAQLILEIFLVSMPKDFYQFYEFCKELKPNDPSTAFKIVDIKLVGPYDILNGTITKNTPDKINLLTHWRYYYDPPEFQVIQKNLVICEEDNIYFQNYTFLLRRSLKEMIRRACILVTGEIDLVQSLFL
jgi:hypothetical protein